MELNFNKYYEADASSGIAGGSSRNIELEIDTDIVLAELAKIKTELDNKKAALLKDFSLGGAWSSSNAKLAEQKIAEIDASFTEMQTIIESLTDKVNKYVENTIEADTVQINGETGASSVGQVQ